MEVECDALMTSFPEDFFWGAATSAYQVEGSPLADGAGPSIWHRFSHTPGQTYEGHTGDVACDHYRRFEDDVQLMQQLGLQAYRFSVSWSRIFPEGVGTMNTKGLDFYERLVDALLAHGIQPMITLYHWDLPAALGDRGGWTNPDSVHWFADYAATVIRALDDRVKLWVTLNEPWVVTDGGYLHGVLAPGHKSAFETVRATHHLLHAHGAAVEVYRAEGNHQVGIVVNLEPKYPASDDSKDQAAAARADAYMNRQYLDPIFWGDYPAELADVFGEAWTTFPNDDLGRVQQPIDFLGVNYYKTSVTRHEPEAWPTRAADVRQVRQTHTELDWPVTPQGLTDTLTWVRERYGDIPLFITENGAAFYDPPVANGTIVEDPLRCAYYREHLRAVHAAISQGVDVRGYFAWSLLDNFEWAQGYSKRFGLVHVDFETQRRTRKASALMYRDIIRTNGNVLFEKDT